MLKKFPAVRRLIEYAYSMQHNPDKEIEAAIVYAEQNGWIFKDSGKSAHAWGKLLCPLHTRDGHKMSIWSTPRNTFNHAQQIKRLVDKCQHDASEENE